MALYAFDGTWNSGKTSEDSQYTNTNVFRFYQAYHKNSNSDDLYVPGVGTRFDLVGRVLGGVFGLGELPRIEEAYDHLCKAWVAGDHAIDIVGFSRGAATTLDFCHHIQTNGIRRPGSDDPIEPSPQIRFLGVWDVVAAFGLANLGNTELNIGHHLSLPKASLQYCFHALALDERRLSFLPTRLQGACEVWFRGVHSDIGGGNGNEGLNDITLGWMLHKAKAAGLPIGEDSISSLRPNPATLPHQGSKLPLQVRVISAVDRRHYTVSPLSELTNPPETCSVETPADEQRANVLGPEGLGVLSPDARVRLNVLWETATSAAAQLAFPIDGAREGLLNLFQARISLITNDDQLQSARESVVQLVGTIVGDAQRRSIHMMSEFLLNEAMFKLRHLFPFTDD
ncbi:MAG: hypothetical protein PVSMB1_06530 [Gemmatimonadaceae bacterium]